MVTRRVLLAAAGALAASATPAEVRLPKRLRAAIIGFEGHPGEITGPLPSLPDVEIVAICDAEPKILARQSKNPRLSAARQYSKYSEMLDREKLDFVAVCNNNGERAGAVIACAQRKLNVIAEKPLGITRKEIADVRKTVETNKVALGMLLPMRFDPPYLALKKIVSEGLIGEVAQIGAQKSYIAGDRPAWFLNKKTYGSTILWIGVHMFDLMRWTSGREFTEAAGFRGRVGFPELREMDNITASMFHLDNGGVATLRMDYLRSATAETHEDDRLRLAGLTGIAEYQASTGVTLMTHKSKPKVMMDLPQKGSVFVDFLQSTYDGKTPALPIADIWKVNDITIAAHEAAEGSKIVRI